MSRLAKFGTIPYPGTGHGIDSCSASLVLEGIVGYVKGFTAQVCAVNSSSPFLLFVSGSK